MTSYRISKHTAPRKLLLPLSLGISSTSLLHVLDRHRNQQLGRGLATAGYELHVLVVDPVTVHPDYTDVTTNYENAKKHYPDHTYSMIPLHSIFQYDSSMKDTLWQFGFTGEDYDSDKEWLDAFRAALSTTTAKDDIDNLLLVRLIVAFAKQNGCESVLWGDSDSRLAAKTLANVAKGRGASLTWQVCDGPSPWGVKFHFPLRELYKFELDIYVKQIPELASIIIPDLQVQENESSRNLSIDNLMNLYVKTQGEKYPGVMANVVRTTNKLQPAAIKDVARCSLCAAAVDETTASLCYACLRSKADVSQRSTR